ncbi:MAG: hypothetical protein IKA51_03590 [Clostridia bacterium]|nr:hypothetical protein [Clostridia bacterium]
MKIKIYGLGTIIPFILSTLISLFVGFSDVPNEGLSCLFLLPLTFAFTILFFSKEYSYCLHSFGLVILYATSFVRYIVTPILIVVSQSTVSTIMARDSDYMYAIFVEIFELIILMLTIKIVWPKHLAKKEQIKKKVNYDPSQVTFRLSWLGAIFAVLLIILIMFRGHWDNIVSNLSTWFTRVDNNDIVFGYDMMAFNIVKAIAFLIIVSLMKLMYNKTSFRILPVIISLAAAILNTMFFEYRERTDLAVLIIASFFVLRYAFPQSKKFFSVIFGVGGIVLVATVFMEGTLRYEVGSSLSSVNIADYSKMAELYTTGPSILANARMNFESVRSQVNFMTFAKDLVLSCDLFSTLPFLRFVLNAVSSGQSTGELYVASIGGLSYILPNHSLASLYVGDIICWIIEPLFIVFNIKLLAFFERCMYRINDLLQVYAIFSIVTMVAMGVFCNNVQLMLHSFSSLPLWLLIFSYINNLGNKIKLAK